MACHMAWCCFPRASLRDRYGLLCLKECWGGGSGNPRCLRTAPSPCLRPLTPVAMRTPGQSHLQPRSPWSWEAGPVPKSVPSDPCNELFPQDPSWRPGDTGQARACRESVSLSEALTGLCWAGRSAVGHRSSGSWSQPFPVRTVGALSHVTLAVFAGGAGVGVVR